MSSSSLRLVLATSIGISFAGVALGACERATPPDRGSPAKAAQAVQPLAAPAAQSVAPSTTTVPTAKADDVMGSPDPHVVLPSLPPASPQASLYDLKLTLTDDASRRTGFDVFRGSPVVVSMFYASCPHACPMLLSEIKALEAALSPAARGKLRVLLVSLNPEKDTPRRLAGLKKKIGVDAERWRFGQVPSEQVRELAAVLGIQYQKLPDGSFNHSSILTLLRPDGRPASRIDGLGKANAEMVQVIEALARAR